MRDKTYLYRMTKPIVLKLVLWVFLLSSRAFAQVKYINSNNSWDPDSLGDHRAVVTVTTQSTVAKVVLEWRRQDDPAGKEIIVTDAVTGRRVINVKLQEISREKGVIIFQPVSGPGKYYIYYMPFHVKKGSNYPEAVYLKWHDLSDVGWLSQLPVNPPAATVQYLESINALNSLYPMEVIATDKEVKALTSQYSNQPFLVFPEDRLHPIKMKADLPQRWIFRSVNNTFKDTAERGENFAFQLGIFASKEYLHNVKVKFGDLKNKNGHILPGRLFSCLNTDGINWDGSMITNTVGVKKGDVQALWCLVTIPKSAAKGTYSGNISVTANGSESIPVKIVLFIKDKLLADGGVSEPWKQTRLKWLNSTLGQKNDVIKPYTPLIVKGHSICLLGRKLTLNNNGLPAQIQTYFTEEMTGIGARPRNVLSSPFRFSVVKQNGAVEKCVNGTLSVRQTEPGTVTWSATNTCQGLSMQVKGRLEFDGFSQFTVMFIAKNEIKLEDIRMDIPFRQDVAQYMMGLNRKGGKMPDTYSWKWDVAHKNQDGAWIGDVNAGLQFSLRDEHYVRPLNTNFYLDKPLVLPSSWGNEGKGGIDIKKMNDQIIVSNYSGARTLKKGDTLYYNFNLMMTPFHPINTDEQWAMRFYHRYNNVDSIKATGATVVNIHQGTPINPYINYPFIRAGAMKNFIDSAHRAGLKVKIYNTVRELSNSAYELFPLRSLGHEIFSPGKGGGYAWLQEHLRDDYIAAWYEPAVHDAAIINSGMSRWHNYYVAGMDWLVNNVGIDGIYLDDVAYDRVTMKRIKRVLTQNGHPGIIDLHSANQFNRRDGFNNSANLYMDHFPYLNRLWFGEYFDYEHNDPAFFLTEVSGIPFGLMGEMLQGGGNPWRGMIYGMTNRLPWSDNADPRPIWKAWNYFGIAGSRMIGYWVKNSPVKTSEADILATIYKKNKKAMVAIASWADNNRSVRLTIDWNQLGIDPAKAVITAPGIKNFQPARKFTINDKIPVEKGKGWLLLIEEKDGH